MSSEGTFKREWWDEPEAFESVELSIREAIALWTLAEDVLGPTLDAVSLGVTPPRGTDV